MSSACGRDDGVDGEEPEARWGVDQHVVVVGHVGFERVLEAAFAARQVNQLDLGAGQRDVGRARCRDPAPPWGVLASASARPSTTTS